MNAALAAVRGGATGGASGAGPPGMVNLVGGRRRAEQQAGRSDHVGKTREQDLHGACFGCAPLDAMLKAFTWTDV